MSKNKIYTASEVIHQINLLNEIFRDSRANYPHIRDEDIGKFEARPFNKVGSKFIVKYTEPITERFQEFNNRIAHFLNQNFLIRLFSTLQSYGGYKKFDKNKYPELYVLKRLRNKFGHALGSFQNSEDDRNLMRHIVRTFNLEDKQYKDFPINIDTVINPIIKASIQFVKEQYP